MKIPFKRTSAPGLLVAILAGVTIQAHAQTSIPRPTPPPQPPVPAGLVVGDRQIDRQDVGEYYALHGVAQPFPGVPSDPAFSEHNSVNVTAYVQQGRRGRITRSFAPMWIDSTQATRVSVSLGEGALDLDSVPATADVVSARVRDSQGNVVTVAQRAYGIQGTWESLDVTVRVDAKGKLLPLPVVRLARQADGTVGVIRDGNFAESLSIQYRLVQTGASLYVPTQTVVIPAGAASIALPIRAQAGDVLTLRAGNGYTPNPAEGSDAIQF